MQQTVNENNINMDINSTSLAPKNDRTTRGNDHDVLETTKMFKPSCRGADYLHCLRAIAWLRVHIGSQQAWPCIQRIPWTFIYESEGENRFVLFVF